MKLISLFTLLFSMASFAQTQLSLEKQTAFVEKIAKDARRDYWRSGHKYVGTTVEAVSKEGLDDYIQDNHLMEEPLNKTQISGLYKCHYSKKCSLFLIHLSASYMGGDGSERIWVLLNPFTATAETYKHLVYAE